MGKTLKILPLVGYFRRAALGIQENCTIELNRFSRYP